MFALRTVVDGVLKVFKEQRDIAATPATGNEKGIEYGKFSVRAIPYCHGWNVPYDIHNFATFFNLVTIHY